MFPNFRSNYIPIGQAWLLGLVCACSPALARSPLADPSHEVPARPAKPADSAARIAKLHLKTIRAAAKARTDEALCAAVASADETQHALGRDLQRQRDHLFEKSPADALSLDRLERAAAGTADRLPGVGLTLGAETVYHFVRYGALASYAPPGSASEGALRLAGDIWSGPAGQAIYFEPSTDISGCHRPSALVPILRDLAATWPSVAACLKPQLGARLMASVDELTNGTCFCEGQSATASALDEIDSLARAFTDDSRMDVATTGVARQTNRAREYLCR